MGNDRLSEVMLRIRKTIYSLFPTTYGYSIIYLKNDGKRIVGQMQINLLIGLDKKISINYDYLLDDLEIKEISQYIKNE